MSELLKTIAAKISERESESIANDYRIKEENVSDKNKEKDPKSKVTDKDATARNVTDEIASN